MKTDSFSFNGYDYEMRQNLLCGSAGGVKFLQPPIAGRSRL